MDIHVKQMPSQTFRYRHYAMNIANNTGFPFSFSDDIFVTFSLVTTLQDVHTRNPVIVSTLWVIPPTR